MTDRLPASLWAAEDLERLAAAGLLRALETRSSPQGPAVTVAGARYVNLSSNDYLALANHPRLVEAAAGELLRSGVGAGASRLLAGDTDAHRALERTIAEHMKAEAALVFNSGYAANTGILAALAGADGAIFSDALNHASIIDGARMSRSMVEIYPHRDVEALDRLLARRADVGRRIIVTESVFSMDGDRAPLRGLVEVAERHGAALMVDEAHALGVLGPDGRGLAAELDLSARIDVVVGTLGKALGSFGAFAAASRPVIDLLVNRARPLVFSTALPPAICAASREAFAILADPGEGGARMRRLHHLVERLRSSDRVSTNEHTPIFSVVLGTPERALGAGRLFRNRGLLAKPIRPPTVPEGTSRLRISLSAGHSDADVDRVLEALASID